MVISEPNYSTLLCTQILASLIHGTWASSNMQQGTRIGILVTLNIREIRRNVRGHNTRNRDMMNVNKVV